MTKSKLGFFIQSCAYLQKDLLVTNRWFKHVTNSQHYQRMTDSITTIMQARCGRARKRYETVSSKRPNKLWSLLSVLMIMPQCKH